MESLVLLTSDWWKTPSKSKQNYFRSFSGDKEARNKSLIGIGGRFIMLLMFLSFSFLGYSQPGTSISSVIEISSFPHLEENVNTQDDGIYLTTGTLGGTACNNLPCCPGLMYKVTLPTYGSLRVENLNYVNLSGSILAYQATVDPPTSWSDLVYYNEVGNFCGYRSTLQIGSYCDWGGSDPVWHDEVGGTPIDIGDPGHVAAPGDYYIFIMNYNKFGGFGSTDSDFLFRFSPYQVGISVNIEELTSISCAGQNDGALRANVSGGTEPYTYSWSNSETTQTISDLYAGTYTVTVTDADGASSTVTHIFTQPDAVTGIDTQVACGSFTWIDGITYTESNNSATHVLEAANGCDSTVTLNLTILENTTGIDVQEHCDSFTWIDGITYTESNNTATHILENAAGCDSTVTLNLTILESTTGIDVQEHCDSYEWIDGITYTESNFTATHVVENAAGCDSTVTLKLTILESNTGIDVQEHCDSYTWIDGITYTESNNTATHVLENASGCDSTVTLNLTILESTTGIDVQEHCDSYEWIDGITYTESNNTATHVLENASGCDSTVTLNLTILESTTGVDVQEHCDSYEWINGVTYTESNFTATHIFENAIGCDSVVTLNLTIDDVENPTVNTQDFTVQLDENGQTSITVSDIDNGSYDNCGIASMNLDITEFDCDDIGENTVTLTSVDNYDNIGSNTAVVTVEDNILPTVLTQNITVQLDENGQASIAPTEIDNGSSDNCSIATMELDITDFDCGDVGGTLVTLTVTDVNGNSNTNTAVVTLEDNILPTVLTHDITVELDANGQASITTSDINNGSSDNCGIAETSIDMTDFDCNDVGENTVTLTVTDVNGNSANNSAVVTVVDNVAPVVGTIENQVITSGEDCMAELADYTIDLEYSDNCQVQSVVQTPAPGTLYDLNTGVVSVSIEVTDTYGNTSSTNFEVDFNDPLAFEITGVETGNITTCNEWPDGFIIVNTSVDSNLLLFSIYNTYSWQGYNNHFIGLDADTYTVRAKNMNGCIQEWPEPVTILPAPEIILDNLVVDDFIECYGTDQGSIEVIASDGTGSFLYSIDNGITFQESNIFQNLAPGTYQIQISDEVGCIYEHYEAIVIDQAEQIQFTGVTITNVTGCYGEENGSISIASQGGVGTMEYSIDNGQSWSTNITFANLAAGTYYVLAKDANGCEITYENNPVQIAQPEELLISTVSSDDATCNGTDDGSITISAIGGTGTLECSVNNGQTWENTNHFTDLTAGTYNVIVKDANGCEQIYANNPITISEPAPIEITNVELGEIVCNQESITLEVNALGGFGELEFSIDNGSNWNTSGDFTLYADEQYNVMVRDENGCELTYENNPVSFEAIYSSDLGIEVSPDYEVCEGETITLTAVCEDNVDYMWNPGNNTTAVMNVSEDVGSYEYTVTATNQFNCVSQETIEIIFTDCTGIDDIDDASIILFPNPNSGDFTIELKTNSLPDAVRIYSAQGKLVYEQKAKDFIALTMSFKLSNLNPGVYYTQIEFEGRYIIRKMIIRE